MTDFSSLNLHPALQNTLRKTGYTTPTPIQAQAIPKLLAGSDLLGIAQTGTGKTAAFALPIIDRLARQPKPAGPKGVRALILTPTRELASQINANIATYGHGFRLSHTVIFGGVGQTGQVRVMSRGVDILTATPGRLLDLIGQGHVRLDKVEVFVLDEADRMLDMGFIHDIQKIIARLPTPRQTMLFSATMPDEIAHLAHGLLTNPERVEVTPAATTVERVQQKVLMVERVNKPSLLNHLLAQQEMERVLVFTRTKHGADRVTESLAKESIRAVAIHGNKSQNAREAALGQFRSGQARVLVATDIAARGIDVSGISHVINFDLPNEPESYVHRIGRTARAGREGVAISLCDAATEHIFLRDIERTIRQKVTVDADHPYHCEPALAVVSAAAGRRGPASGGRPASSGGYRGGASSGGGRSGSGAGGSHRSGAVPASVGGGNRSPVSVASVGSTGSVNAGGAARSATAASGHRAPAVSSNRAAPALGGGDHPAAHEARRGPRSGARPARGH
ncbi:MAG: DEAD/DEAH box helicase [Magnetococcales bacterium]|nr:DEAD/DEAH box helicase [Magnetococcales bacterium]